MNHIYRLVYNHALGLMQVTSEIGTSAGRGRSGAGSSQRPPLLAPLAGALLLAGSLQAGAQSLPQNGQIITGSASINSSGNMLNVNQSTQSALIQWQNFNIGAGNLVRFELPSPQAVSINQVTGGMASVIAGNMTSNGHVFLLNPSGIAFTGTANVNVGGLLASTLNVGMPSLPVDGGPLPPVFLLAGGGNGATISNNGGTLTASAGGISLVGGAVSNSGLISAANGNIDLVAASSTLVTREASSAGNVRLSFAATAASTAVAIGVINTGTLSARNIGMNAMVGLGLASHGINTGGTIIANAIDAGDGVLTIRSNAPVLSSATITTNTAAIVGSSIDIAGGSISANGALLTANTGNVNVNGTVEADMIELTAATASQGSSGSLQGAVQLDVQGTANLGSVYNRIDAVAGTVGGDLTLVTHSALSNSGALQVTGSTRVTAVASGASTFEAAGDITLDNPQNQFGGSVALKGGTVKLSSQGNLRLGDVDAQALAVSSGGSISQSTATAINVDTTSSFAATNGITLGQGGNVFGGAVTLQAGGAAQVVADGTLRFGTIAVGSLSASGTTIYLPQSLTTQGAQSWSGGLQLEGDTSLSSTLGGLSFYGTLNGPHALSLDAVNGSVHLGAASSIDRLISTTALETQLAADITAEGNLDLGRSRVQGDVALTSTAGSVRINGALDGTTVDADALAITAANQVTILGAAGGAGRLGDLSLTGNTVATARVDVAHDLSINSVTNISQTHGYGVGGASSFSSDGDITLQHTSNQFLGDVALRGNTVYITGRGPLTLSDVQANILNANAESLLTLRDAAVIQSTNLMGNAVQLDSVALGQTSTITAMGGSISQDRALRVDGGSTWTAAGDILLDNDTNGFGGVVNATAANIILTAGSELNLGAISTGGGAQLTGDGVHLGTVQASSLQVQSAGGITQGNALAMTGTAGFNATGDVVLDNVNNTFAAGVQLSGRDIRIDSAGGLTLAGVNATGDLGATAHAGNLLQSAVVSVQGRSDLAASGNVQLDNPGNTFDGAIAVKGQSILLKADGDLDVESLRNGSNGAVQLVATGDIDLGGTAVNTGTNLLSLLSSAGQVRTATALTGSQVSITGTEGIRISGDITAASLWLTSSRNNVEQQAGRIQSGTTLLGAGLGDLLLENTSNRFTGVTTLSGRDVRVAAGDLTLGMVAASRDLHLVSSGSIQQQAQMSVGGAADLRAAGDITLKHINNRFEGDVALQAAQASLYADQGLSLAQVNVDGLEATTLGLLSLRDAQVTGLAELQGGSLALARANVGRLDANAFAGGISQSDTVTLGDGSELRATGNVMLDRPDNRLGSGLQVRAADVVLSTLDVLDQADVQASGLARLSGEGVRLGTVSAGSLQVYSQGDIDQSVALQVTGDSRFSASGDIRLGHAGNQFRGGVQLAGRDVRVENAGHLRLDGVAAGGDLVVVAHGGGIGQTASVAVGGRSDLTARDDIILQQAGNTFGSAVALEASAIRLAADSNLEVDGLRTRNGGTAQLEADGNLTLSGDAIGLAGGSLLATAIGGQLRTRTALNGAAVVLQGRDGVEVGADITAAQVIVASDVGDVVQVAGRILASGSSALVSNGGNIVIENADNRFNDTLLLIGEDIRVAAGDLQLAGVQASGDLSLTSSGNIVQTAQMTVDGTSRFAAGGDITLQHADNRLNGRVEIDGRDVQLYADAGLNLQTVNARNLDAHAGTTLVLDNAIVRGDATVQGQELRLGDSRIGGNLVATSLATIQQTAALRITGTSQLQAGGGIHLDQAGNHFGGRVDIDAASASITSADNMQLGRITTTGDLQVSADAGLRLDGQIHAANVDLATTGIFDNRAGSSAIALSGPGRWQVYLASPFQNHVFGGLDSGNTALWNTAAFAHAAGSANRYLFAWQPTLTVTANTLRKVYGDSFDPRNAFSITGAMAGVSGAYLADNVAELTTGTPLLASMGASATAGVSATPYALDISAGTLDTGTSGYALSFVRGELWVDPRALTITANNGSKTYGQSDGF
ncbi:filamentous hemagglutinin N-terminal domain-containing protein, partial [uncultured Stenotrophomonas sp.]|uniref:two-partner secretion domain-containing protein n=1 Tax=uncultured Stenotrophomonas sp. TaxID=165438 RepID=UPI0025E31AC1